MNRTELSRLKTGEHGISPREVKFESVSLIALRQEPPRVRSSPQNFGWFSDM